MQKDDNDKDLIFGLNGMENVVFACWYSLQSNYERSLWSTNQAKEQNFFLFKKKI